MGVKFSRFLPIELANFGRSVSKLGACLIMSADVEANSELTLEFEGKPKSSQARVVWARETGNPDERLVGAELAAPLREV